MTSSLEIIYSHPWWTTLWLWISLMIIAAIVSGNKKQ